MANKNMNIGNSTNNVDIKVEGSVQTNKIIAPSSLNNLTTFGTGLENQMLMSNGENTYWGFPQSSTIALSTSTLNNAANTRLLVQGGGCTLSKYGQVVTLTLRDLKVKVEGDMTECTIWGVVPLSYRNNYEHVYGACWIKNGYGTDPGNSTSSASITAYPGILYTDVSGAIRVFWLSGTNPPFTWRNQIGGGPWYISGSITYVSNNH